MRRAYELRDKVTAYDAASVALAETLGCHPRAMERRRRAAPEIETASDQVSNLEAAPGFEPGYGALQAPA